MKKIYSVLVENRSGVLCKVAGLFSRRCFNIDSLAVGETDDPAISCMTIVSSGDLRTVEQIEKQLNKKLDVIKVKTFSESASISRELMLVKVKYNKNNRRDIMEICEIMKAQIVDMSKNLLMIQICDVPEKINLLISMLQSVSIVEVARTGTLALPKCMEADSCLLLFILIKCKTAYLMVSDQSAEGKRKACIIYAEKSISVVG